MHFRPYRRTEWNGARVSVLCEYGRWMRWNNTHNKAIRDERIKHTHGFFLFAYKTPFPVNFHMRVFFGESLFVYRVNRSVSRVSAFFCRESHTHCCTLKCAFFVSDMVGNKKPYVCFQNPLQRGYLYTEWNKKILKCERGNKIPIRVIIFNFLTRIHTHMIGLTIKFSVLPKP